MTRSLNLLYVHGESIGYGRYGVNLARELTNLGVEIYDHMPGPTDRLTEHLNQGRNAGIAETVCWVSVPTHAMGWYKNQRRVIATMWESTHIPPSFRESLDAFDVVIVPSDQNVELFSNYHPNVKRVLLGVDPTLWHYVPRKPPGMFFNYLIAGSGLRKGTDLVYKAFRKVWPDGSWGDGPIPRLIMKNPRGEDFYGDRIEMIAGRIPVEQEIALYEQAHCYLQPSRGEGFGLQPLQALSQGCPTILTGAHGHASFSHLGMPLSAKPSKSEYFIYGDAGDWWEPNFEELCYYMRWVYDNYETACHQAKHAAEVIASDFTWRRTGESFLEALGDLPLRDYTGSMEWAKPVQRLYQVVTNRDWACDIAGSSYQFKKDQEYWELADVKRILFEAGLLANDCLIGPNGETNLDHGLLPQQAERIPQYTARHSFCELCGQKLGSGVTKADEEWLLLQTS